MELSSKQRKVRSVVAGLDRVDFESDPNAFKAGANRAWCERRKDVDSEAEAYVARSNPNMNAYAGHGLGRARVYRSGWFWALEQG